MAKAEWGTKRSCTACGIRFYDLQHDPIICPSCGGTVDIVVASRSRRSRAATPKLTVVAAAPEAKVAEEADEDEPEEEATDGQRKAKAAGPTDGPDAESDDESDDDGESAIEDVSELGDDDVSKVIETDLDDPATER